MTFANPVASPADPSSHLLRMSDARKAVPRREGESRSQWKNRVFQYKRKEEEKLAK